MIETLGHEIVGEGPARVLVLHDWFGDCREWLPLRSYLTTARFTYAFADLRGYGRSRHIAGDYALAEAVSDLRALADRLGWERFAVVGHSMSTIVAQKLAQALGARVERVVLVTPVAPSGMGLDDTMYGMSQQLALATDERRLVGAKMMWGDRLSETWIRFKLAQWRDAALPAAAAAYVDLWGRTDVSAGAGAVTAPMLLVACEQDQPPFRREAVDAWRRKYYPHASLVSFAESGHYPMQEAPPLLATAIERFLS
jgi:pimeloyl-ACP methyl ester carboxylesterase